MDRSIDERLEGTWWVGMGSMLLIVQSATYLNLCLFRSLKP